MLRPGRELLGRLVKNMIKEGHVTMTRDVFTILEKMVDALARSPAATVGGCRASQCWCGAWCWPAPVPTKVAETGTQTDPPQDECALPAEGDAGPPPAPPARQWTQARAGGRQPDEGWQTAAGRRKRGNKARWTRWEWATWRSDQKTRQWNEQQKVKDDREETAARTLQRAFRAFLARPASETAAACARPAAVVGAKNKQGQKGQRKKLEKDSKLSADEDSLLDDAARQAEQERKDAEELAAPLRRALSVSIRDRDVHCPEGHGLEALVAAPRARCWRCRELTANALVQAYCVKCDFALCPKCVRSFSGKCTHAAGAPCPGCTADAATCSPCGT